MTDVQELINSGQASNTANGTPAAIVAAYLGGTSAPSTTPNPPLSGIFGDVIVTNGGAINATTGIGINAFNYGTGDVSVSNTSAINASVAGMAPRFDLVRIRPRRHFRLQLRHRQCHRRNSVRLVDRVGFNRHQRRQSGDGHRGLGVQQAACRFAPERSIRAPT